VSSILKDTSISRPKTKNKVRFEDSPETSNTYFSLNSKDHFHSESSAYNKQHFTQALEINLNDSVSSMNFNTPINRSPSNKFFNKQRIATDKNYSEQLKTMKMTNEPSLGNVKQSPVKVVAVHEVSYEVSEPRFVPKVINYAFRNEDFYEKLSKFYANPEKKGGNKREQEKIVIRLDPSLIGKNTGIERGKGEKEHQKGFIRLKPCPVLSPGKEKDIRGRSLSPAREKASPLKKCRISGQNILN
jgi:hypothetical protein